MNDTRRYRSAFTHLAAMFLLTTLSTSVRAETTFIRADVHPDGQTDITDAVASMSYLFLGTFTPRCLDAADADDDGAISVGDPIYTLSFILLGGSPPASPYPECGVDLTPDQLGCDTIEPEVCPYLPTVESVVAVSNHYVLVTFDRQPGAAHHLADSRR